MNLLPEAVRDGSAQQRARLLWRPIGNPLRRPAPAGESIPEGGTDSAVLRRDTRYRRLLALADAASAAAAVLLGVMLLGSGDSVAPWMLGAVLLAIVVAKTLGLYDRDEHVLNKTTLDEAPLVFQVATLFTLLVWLGEDLFVDGQLGKDQIVGLWALCFVLMLSTRTAARRMAPIGTRLERCLVVGDPESAAWLERKLLVSPNIHAVVVGRVPLDESEPTNGSDVLAGLSTLGLVLVEHEIERAIIVPGDSDSAEILDVVRLVRSLGIKVSVVPRLFEVVGASIEFDDVEGVTLLGLRKDGLTKSSRFVKRSMDLLISVVGLVLLAPLLAMIAAAVKLTSPGPVFFRQKRVGFEGREFKMIKFRTMVEGAERQKASLRVLNESEGLFKIANDPRLTRLGRFLRRSSLDELPQLFNVVRGEMSLVGPRPLVPDEDSQVAGWDRRRLHVPPGITGSWQLFGPARIPLNEMVKLDYLYGANWSLWQDIKILARTVPHAVCRRGL
ncbi:MAG TPA: sugar transferase [Thermoleophilaceae bacterium]|nr:sugar transferase [Thermoleophilaceae bacterium]